MMSSEAMRKVTEEIVNPFVRCVGRGTGVYQKVPYCAYDYRLVYIAEGNGSVFCNGAVRPSEAGDLFIFAPGTPFSIQCGPMQSCIVVNFDWTQNHAGIGAPVLSVEAEEFSADRIIEKMDLSPLLGDGEVIIQHGLFEAEDILQTLYRAYLVSVRPNGMLMSGLLKQVLGIVTEAVGRGHTSNGRQIDLAARITAYVRENYAMRLTLEAVAEYFHYHPTYINRVMKAAAGVSFHQYLMDYRLKQSLQLLELNTMTLDEIAAKVGFANSKHFSACFKKRFQVSPSRYKECQF